MNIKNKFLAFGIFSSLLIGILLFVQVSAQEESFTNYLSEEYGYIPSDSQIEQLEGQNVQVQQNIETGVLTIKGIGENSVVKIDIMEYDLSGGGELNVDSITGEILPGSTFNTPTRNINQGNLASYSSDYELSDNKKLKIPAGTKVEILEKGINFEFSEYAGKYSGETLSLENVEEFELSFIGADETLAGRKATFETFDFKTEKNSKMNFLNGDFSFTQGQVSMGNGIWDFPEGSKVEKFPETEKLMNVKIGNYDLGAEMIVRGNNLAFSKIAVESLGFKEDINFNGDFAFNKGNVFVPPGSNTKLINQDITLSPIGTAGRSASDTYIFGSESVAKNSGQKNYALVSKEMFDLKTGGIESTGANAGQVEVKIGKDNPWFGKNNPIPGGRIMEDNDHFVLLGEATGDSSRFTIFPTDGINNPNVLTEGSSKLIQDSKEWLVNPNLGSTGSIRVRELHDGEGNPLFAGAGSVPLVVNSKFKSDKYTATIFVNDPDKVYFADLGASPKIDLTNRQSEQLIGMPEAFVDEFKVGKKGEVIRMAMSKSQALGDNQFRSDLVVHDRVANNFRTLQRNAGQSY